MATSYSANQYDNAFVPKHLQSWETSRSTSDRPKSTKSCKAMATIDGRVLFEYKREDSFKTNYVNTWDLPKRLPGSNIDNPTARDFEAYKNLHNEYADSKLALTGQKFNYRPSLPVAKGKKVNKRSQDDSTNQTTANGQDSNSLRDRDHEQHAVNDRGITPGSDVVMITDGSDLQDQRETICNKIPLPDFSREFSHEEQKVDGLVAL